MSDQQLIMKTAHEFARELLAGPDLPVVVPKVAKGGYDDSGETLSPSAVEFDGEDVFEQPMKVILIDGSEAP